MKIKNKFLSFFLGKLDFVFRFIYCRFSILSKTICRNKYSSSHTTAVRNTQVMMDMLGDGFRFKDKECMELGPGDTLVSACDILALGAKKVILVDKFPRMKLTGAKESEVTIKKNEILYLLDRYKNKTVDFLSQNGIDSKYYKFIEGDIIDLKFNDKFDFTYSLYVLEHVKSVKETIKAIADATMSGGISYHAIGLMDHYNLNDPFLFYKYSDYVWDNLLTREGVSYTNRMRYDDYLTIFKEVGFEVIAEIKNIEDLNGDVKLSRYFSTKDWEALSVIGVNFLLKKV